ncbi:MAG: Outer membrane protein, OmpA/MotB family [Candidatus Ozemobacter sibiricus]|uniref:Outer membrane protein, OmpA/MotB family n=1 Tax=Candidatus Ozemobacter sibiricus TaxID=2268124 RepID=A0A367ZLP7_9BACT|nr:MAG: Outer membrane protein, OmpA/MotB family [Candidatus Ozemobacter sibiricus]
MSCAAPRSSGHRPARLRWLPLLLVLAGGPVVVAQTSRTATDLMGEALKWRARGQLSDAIRSLEQAVGAAPRAAQRTMAQFMLGDCLLEAGQAEAARAVYAELLSADLTDDERAEARYRLAQSLERLGRIDEARRLCREIARQHRGSSFAQLARLLEATLDRRSAPPSEYISAEEAAQVRAASPVKAPPPSAAAPTSAAPKAAAPARPASSRPDPLPDEEPDAGGPLPDETGADDEAVATAEPAPEKAPAPASVPAPTTRSTRGAGAGPAGVAAAPASSQASGRAEEPKAIAPPSRGAPPSSPPPAPVGFPADLLRFPPTTQAEREALASEILQAQEALQRSPEAPDNDTLLFRMASATARFGEHLEACKTYDRLLTQFPSSQYVEEAYYEAIRLRAYLKVYKPVVEWGETFLQTFPRSSRGPAVRRLIAFARAQLQKPGAAPRPAAASGGPAAPGAAGSGASAASAAPAPRSARPGASRGKLADDPRYQEAKRRVAAERYSLALRDFEALSRLYPDDPAIWWDLALVQVQQERHGEAEVSLNRLLALDPNNQDARSLLGYCHYQRKDYQKAADVYGQTGESSAASGEGLTFFDPQNAAKRMQQSRPKARPAASAAQTHQGEEP